MDATRFRSAGGLSTLGLTLLLLGVSLSLAGCYGYVEGDGGGPVVVAEPDLYFFGGYYDGPRGRDYGRRGAESRGYVAHPAPGRAGVVPVGRRR